MKDRKVIRPTRFYSDKQEKKVAKEVTGQQTANSGATKFQKGDVLSDEWLIECKCHTERRDSFTIKKAWIDKNKEEAFQMGKSYSALAIQFEPDGENYYLIDSKMFKQLLKSMED